MAEGLLNNYYSNKYEGYSAGTKPSYVNKYAIKVMDGIGIDISSQRSKSINEFLDRKFDYVITVCDSAKETCPYFPKAEVLLHKSFEDPSKFTGSDEEITEKFRDIRDQIFEYIKKQFGGKNDR